MASGTREAAAKARASPSSGPADSHAARRRSRRRSDVQRAGPARGAADRSAHVPGDAGGARRASVDHANPDGRRRRPAGCVPRRPEAWDRPPVGGRRTHACDCADRCRARPGSLPDDKPDFSGRAEHADVPGPLERRRRPAQTRHASRRGGGVRAHGEAQRRTAITSYSPFFTTRISNTFGHSFPVTNSRSLA